MPRYWVIAPYHADDPEGWEQVWDFDLKNGIISIGWTELGDVRSLSEEEVCSKVEQVFDYDSQISSKNAARMVYRFYHSIQPGDRVIARRGTKRLAAVGTVKSAAYFDATKNKATVKLKHPYGHHIDVAWDLAPRDVSFERIVFGLQTLHEFSEEKYLSITDPVPDVGSDLTIGAEEVEDPIEFGLEKYLEEFIVTNFDTIFRKRLALYSSPDLDVSAHQFQTDVGTIDILAREVATGDFVVIELKKGRSSDKVVGQLLRYMGWVTENLCDSSQKVRGVIICKDADDKLNYSLKMMPSVSVQYFKIDFRLQDSP
jgi:hypothetical protein